MVGGQADWADSLGAAAQCLGGAAGDGAPQDPLQGLGRQESVGHATLGGAHSGGSELAGRHLMKQPACVSQCCCLMSQAETMAH